MNTAADVNRATDWGPFIDGALRAVNPARTFTVADPSTGRTYAEVIEGGPEDVERAVSAAERALPAWRNLKPLDRGRAIAKVGAALLSQVDRLAQMETQNTGKPLRISKGEVIGTARYFEYYGTMADKLQAETIPLGNGYVSYTRYEPHGVVGIITPWNGPIQQVARSAAPALLMGNTIIVKPAEQTPITAIELARIASDCGIPPGVFNVVPGFGIGAGTALVEHRGVRKIAFTGSVETGRLIAVAAAKRIVPVTLELGGKSANIVFADADIDAAARGAWLAITLNTGQICSAGSRLLVERPIVEQMVAALSKLNAETTIGAGSEDKLMGPLASEEQLEKVNSYIELAAREGANVIQGGPQTLPPHGYFVRPTLLIDVRNDMRVAREEIFGPVLSIIPFNDESEAVSIANDSDYGLAAGIWTNNISRAHRLSAQLEVGQVYVNEYWAGGIETPFGGVKNSGYGREKGIAGALDYAYIKTVTIKL